MSKLIPGLGSLHGAGKWIMVSVTTLAAIIGLLVNARSLGLTPWLGLGGVSLANLEARRVSLAPAHDTLTALGDTLQLAATVTDAHGAIILGATLLWNSDDSAVVTVDSSGAVVARGSGEAIVSATVHEHTGNARVAVAQRATSVVIARDTAVRLPEGGTAQLVARALDARHHVVPGRAIGWASGDSAIASISPSGSVSARAPGRTTITASLDGLSASIPAEVSLAPASVRLLAGDSQRAPAGRRLPRAVSVQILSRGGKPVPGAAVAFTAADGQGRVDPAAATTDRGGRAGAAWTLGPQPGRQHLEVSVAGVDSAVQLTAEADPVPANTRIQATGEAPQGSVGTPLAAPVGIRVADAGGAALADVPVAWTTTDGTVEALAPRTDSLGQAWAHWTLAGRAGIQRARVQVGNPRTMAPFTVTARALPGAAVAAVMESGADQDGPVGGTLKHPIVVRLTDRDGNVVAGATLHVVEFSGTVPETALVADTRGRVSVSWTLGRQAGAQALELKVGDGTAVRVSARGRPLEPANIAPAGAPRSAPAGRALARPVVFTVTDAYGNPIPDVQVVFATASGSVTPARVMTDPGGRAATRWTLGAQAGDHALTATVRGTTVRDSVVVRAIKRGGR
jgi:hypothetical protein